MIIFPMKAALLVRPCENDVLVLQSQVFTTKKKKKSGNKFPYWAKNWTFICFASTINKQFFDFRGGKSFILISSNLFNWWKR